jgi:Hydroxyacylglutathione hydrolase C-terminus
MYVYVPQKLDLNHPTDDQQDPEIQKATGKTDPVEVMAKLREMKNNFK